MEQGAVGVSTSLQYPPAPYASTEELIALATEAARFGVSKTSLKSSGGTAPYGSAVRRSAGSECGTHLAEQARQTWRAQAGGFG
jgi:hypothetical protein